MPPGRAAPACDSRGFQEQAGQVIQFAYAERCAFGQVAQEGPAEKVVRLAEESQTGQGIGDAARRCLGDRSVRRVSRAVAPLQRRHEKLVAGNLHRLGQVQGGKGVRARDVDGAAACGKLAVGKPVFFVAEHQGRGPGRQRGATSGSAQPRGEIPHRQRMRLAPLAPAPGKAGGHRKSGKGFFERGKTARAAVDIESVHGHRGDAVLVVVRAIGEDEAGDAHRFHGPAGRAHVAGFLRPAQHHGEPRHISVHAIAPPPAACPPPRPDV